MLQKTIIFRKLYFVCETVFVIILTAKLYYWICFCLIFAGIKKNKKNEEFEMGFQI